MAEIRSKRQFYAMWQAGLLGNRTFVWHRLQDAMASGVPKIGFREMGRGGGAWELAERHEAPEVHRRWTEAGRKFIMDGSVPNDKTTLQGEVCRTERGLESFLCVREEVAHILQTSGLPPMRLTMSAGMHRNRGYLQTRLLLERYMDPASREDLDALLERYPDAAIEFSCFSINTGNIPGRNTIFWEVRNY